MWCSYCGSVMHTIKNCPKTFSGSANRSSMRCSYCGSRKHNISACPATHSGSANRLWNQKSIENDFLKD